MKSLSRVWLFVTPWTVAYQVSLSMGFSRREHWSGLPFPSPGDLRIQGLNPGLPHCRQMLYHLSHQGSLIGLWTSEPVKLLSCVRLFAIPWSVTYQAPPSMEFSRQEYWSGLPFPSPGELPDLWIEPRSPALQADALLSELPGKPLPYLTIHTHWNSVIHFYS